MKIKAMVDKAVKEAVLETFESMDLFGHLISPDDITATSRKDVMWSWTEIKEPLAGQLVLLMPERLQREVFLRMIHAGVEEVSKEDLVDVQCELTNILAGRLINLLVEGSVSPSISFPKTGTGVPDVRSGSWRYLAFEIGDSWMMLFVGGDTLLHFGSKSDTSTITRKSGFHAAVDPDTTRHKTGQSDSSMIEATDIRSIAEISGRHGILQDEDEAEPVVKVAADDVAVQQRQQAQRDMNETVDDDGLETETSLNALPVQIKGYSIKKMIGEGAMSSVYLAVQENLDRQVAIKVMNPSFNNDDNYVKRFMREARLAAAVMHPNVVSVHDVGQENSCLYMSLQYVSGGDLDEMLKREGHISEDEAINLFSHILRGLQAIADAGLVHRDLKPANILLGYDGTPLIADLGMARPKVEEHQNEELTMAGTLIGTPAYMSPEQALSEENIDIRSDIFSIGITLYLALTGHRPFEGRTPMDTIMKIVKDPVPDPHEHVQDISKGMIKVLGRALEKEPGKRFQKPADFAEALENLRGEDNGDSGKKGNWLHRMFGR